MDKLPDAVLQRIVAASPLIASSLRATSSTLRRSVRMPAAAVGLRQALMAMTTELVALRQNANYDYQAFFELSSTDNVAWTRIALFDNFVRFSRDASTVNRFKPTTVATELARYPWATMTDARFTPSRAAPPTPAVLARANHILQHMERARDFSSQLE
jgi:hypothetical protein